MANLFISHSSKNKEFARTLANDLKVLGHEVWLDEWEIKVGDDIVAKIEHGLSKTDFIVVALSKHAVESGWVDREWKAKYWDEVNQGRVVVLPALLEDCEIPKLLQTKKYADFRHNYGPAFLELASAIQPLSPSLSGGIPVHNLGISGNVNTKVTQLLSKVNSVDQPLSPVIAESLAVATDVQDGELAAFCRLELAGYSGAKEKAPDWRCVQAYLCLGGRLNMEYVGFGGSAQAAWEELQTDTDNFVPRRLCIHFPLAQIESHPPGDPQKTLLCMTLRAGDVVKKPTDPEFPVYAYMPGDTYKRVLAAIRVELTKRLLRLLPEGLS